MNDDELREYEARVSDIREAIIDSVRAGDDLGEVLSVALGQAANRLGSRAALVAGRPGSWEADHVLRLAAPHAQTLDNPFYATLRAVE